MRKLWSLWCRLASDHGDGTDHDWHTERGYIYKCRVCGEVDFYDVRID